VSISPANPVAQTSPAKVQEAVSTTSAQAVANNSSSSVDNTALKFSNGKTNLQKIQIDNSQFILVNSNSCLPFATFNYNEKAMFSE
jgi:hypothetical protein